MRRKSATPLLTLVLLVLTLFGCRNIRENGRDIRSLTQQTHRHQHAIGLTIGRLVTQSGNHLIPYDGPGWYWTSEWTIAMHGTGHLAVERPVRIASQESWDAAGFGRVASGGSSYRIVTTDGVPHETAELCTQAHKRGM